MGLKHSVPFLNRVKNGLQNSRGISLLLIVFLMTAVAISAVGVLTIGVKLREVKKERMVPDRLETIRSALQRYYLSHHSLPDPASTSPPNTIPVVALNLPQEYRFDSAGQFFHYDCLIIDPGPPPVVNIKGLTVHGSTVPTYAAVLVAPGPDKQIASNNVSDPYADPLIPSDDVVVAISLQAEAIKIANRAVTVLQAAAKGYDGQYDSANYNAEFDNANNDGDYLLTTTNGTAVSINPGPDLILGTLDDFVNISDGGDGFCDGTDVPPPRRTDDGPDGIPFTGDDTYDCRVLISLQGKIDEGDEIPIAHGYNGYVPATGGSGVGCVKYGQLSNDPERGTASLDGCPTAVEDIVAVFGLSERYIEDPWGNNYVWGSVEWVDGVTPQTGYGGIEATDDNAAEDITRDRRYWTFFSMGPDKAPDTDDDITPTTDRIVGFYARELPHPP